MIYSDSIYIDYVHPAKDLVRWHRIPARESVLGEYTLFVPVTGESPPIIQVWNNSDKTIEWDITFWMFGVKRELRKEVFRYLSSLYAYILSLGGG